MSWRFAKHVISLHTSGIGALISLHTSGIGALRPGTFKFGYDGGGPYLCMAINHGGGNFSEFWN